MMNTKTQTIPFGKITIEIAPLFIIMLFKGNFTEKLGSQLNKAKQKGPILKGSRDTKESFYSLIRMYAVYYVTGE